MVPSINSLQERIGAPALPKTPLSPPLSFSFNVGTGRLRQSVVGELDDARAERRRRRRRPARIVLPVRCSESEIRSVFLAHNGILGERLREDGVDDGLCRIVAHFIYLFFIWIAFRRCIFFILFSRRTSYGAVVALDERLSCDKLVEDSRG